MKYITFNIGPSELYPTVTNHIQTAIDQRIFSLSHRHPRFQEIFQEAVEGLRKLLEIPKTHHIIFVSSGTESMERIIENTVDRESFHFVNGSFGQRWYEIAQELGKKAQKMETTFGKSFQSIPSIPQETELICFTQNETSSGVEISPEFIYQVAQENPKTLIGVDTVSSSPYVKLDYKKLDCVFFSIQKVFGLPAGLGVIILSPRALQKAKALNGKGNVIGTYHNFINQVDAAQNNFTTDTPNVFAIYLLSKVVKDFQVKGITAIRKEIDRKARYIYEFLDKHPFYKPFVKDVRDRSHTIITLTVGSDAKKIKAKLFTKGITIGNGYGPHKDTQLRIANFPAISFKDVQSLLNEL